MEDITALICTLNFCSSAAIVSETVRSNIADFACLCPISLIFSTAISQPWVQFMQSFKSWLFENMNSTLRLRWSEMNSSRYHMLGNAIKKQKPGQWIPPRALNLTSEVTTCPGLSDGPKAQMTGGTYWRLHPEAYWKVWCPKYSSADCEYSKIRTWYFLSYYCCLQFDLQYQSFSSPFYIHICVLNLLKPKSEENVTIKKSKDYASLEIWFGLEKFCCNILGRNGWNPLHF